MSRSTQVETLRVYLMEGDGRTRGISGLEALSMFGIGHLPSAIYKLTKEPGIQTRSEYQSSEGGAHGPKSFKRYWAEKRTNPISDSLDLFGDDLNPPPEASGITKEQSCTSMS